MLQFFLDFCLHNLSSPYTSLSKNQKNGIRIGSEAINKRGESGEDLIRGLLASFEGIVGLKRDETLHHGVQESCLPCPLRSL